jgi:PRC-barrel domain
MCICKIGETTMAQSGTMTGKPLIESDRVEGTTVYDRQGNNIGSIKRLMIEKLRGRVAYAVMSFGGFLGLGSEEHAILWSKLTYDTRLDGYQTDITESQLTGPLRSLAAETGIGLIGIENKNCTIIIVPHITGGSKSRCCSDGCLGLRASAQAPVLSPVPSVGTHDRAAAPAISRTSSRSWCATAST